MIVRLQKPSGWPELVEQQWYNCNESLNMHLDQDISLRLHRLWISLLQSNAGVPREHFLLDF